MVIIMKKCIIASILALMLSLTTFAQATALPETKINDWAVPDVGRAARLGLLTDTLGTDYTRDITRLQFSELVVNCVEKATGDTIDGSSVKFTDTTSIAAQKSAVVGIVKGTGDGTSFSPNRLITREEVATMLYRAIQYTNPNNNLDTASLTKFSDNAQVSNWAKDAMSSMVGCGIINGTSDNTIAPKANVSIEQAAILIYRLYGQSILKDITPLAEAFVSDQKAIITKLQGAYTSTPSTFSDSRIDSIQMAEVFQENGTTYILYSLKYSVKADNPEAVIVFEDTLKDGWLVINAVTTYVVQMDGGKFTSLGGYTTEFSADGNKEMYKIDFENWLAENILN